MSIQFNMAEAENGQSFITVFANGKLTVPVSDDHPNFRAIVGACQASLAGESVDAQALLDLFDIPTTIERAFQRLSDRVTVDGGEILFDGDPCQPGLSKQILRLMDEGEDFAPLVRFLEKIERNPNDHSKQQAWDWLNNHDFSLTPEGDVVAYKGVVTDGNGGYRSGWRGSAMVNDRKIVNDHIPNAVGDVVTMPRSTVAHDPSQACSRGLHVGTFAYAKGYANGAMLRVIVSPEDIASVPTDAHGEKIRVSRYRVDAIIDAPDTVSVYHGDSAEGGEDEPYFDVGDRVADYEGDRATVTAIIGNGIVEIEYDDEDYGRSRFHADELGPAY